MLATHVVALWSLLQRVSSRDTTVGQGSDNVPWSRILILCPPGPKKDTAGWLQRLVDRHKLAVIQFNQCKNTGSTRTSRSRGERWPLSMASPASIFAARNRRRNPPRRGSYAACSRSRRIEHPAGRELCSAGEPAARVVCGIELPSRDDGRERRGKAAELLYAGRQRTGKHRTRV